MNAERTTWLINFAGFQIGWFACVLGGAYGLGSEGAAAGLVLLLLHLLFTPLRIPELKLIAAAAIMGAVFDTALIQSGFGTFNSGGFGPEIAPPWMIVLWMLFAATLSVSLDWMKQRLWLAAVAGAVSGPLAYFAGARLGAMEILDQDNMLMMLAIGWGLAVPLLVLLATSWNAFPGGPIYRSCHMDHRP